MQLEREYSTAGRIDAVPAAFDGRLLAGVVVLSALAASVNLPYGGVPLALAAFAVLAGGGVAAHVLGERRCRRAAAELAEDLRARGGAVDGVSRSASGVRTEWTVRTPEGPITITGLALAPVSKLSVRWNGIESEADVRSLLDGDAELADEWYATVFA